MDGFKNSTKTSYDTASGRKFANGGMTVSRNDMAGGQGPMSKPAMVAKYAKGGSVKKAEQKVGRVMKEFSEGKLHSGSKKGPEVKNPKQAIAIALSEAGKSKKPVKRAEGTPMGKGPEGDDVLMARMTKEELAQGARGIRMARERMARERARGLGSVSDKEARMMEKSSVKTLERPIRQDKKPFMTIKKEVPPANREPMYGPAKRLSIPLNKGGVTKKATGGLLSPAPKGAMVKHTNKKPQGVGATFANPGGMDPRTAPAPAPSRGLTLSGPNVGRRLTLGMNKGGLSVMPKGKGC